LSPIIKTLCKESFRLVAAGAILFLAGSAWAQLTEQRLKSLGFANESGGNPEGLLVGADGGLYGTTAGGVYVNGIVTPGSGTVFRVNPDGTAYTVLHAFSTNGLDGQNPLAGLVQGRDGMLYGTTSGGGSNNLGAIFKLSINGAAYSVIHTFGSVTNDGASPRAPLIQGSDGLLYGTTFFGGSNSLGLVFKLSTNGTAYSVVYTFGSIVNDGYYPQAALIQSSDGMLYGTTHGTPYASGSGGETAFKLSTNGTGYTQLHTFGIGEDGAHPCGLVWGSNGMLYGTTESGGTNYFSDSYHFGYAGTVFRLDTNGFSYAVIYNFTGTLGDGANPTAPLVLGADGKLYGTTSVGGSLQSDGTVFKINEDGSGYEVIRRFTVITSIFYNYSSDGQDPGPLVQAADGMLYGTTLYGGTAGQGAENEGVGTIYALSTNAGNYSVIHDFNISGGDGMNPQSGLVVGRDGALYGTTQFGGLGDSGAVFKLNVNGSGYEILNSFGLYPSDGLAPQAALIQGLDGMLYGSAYSGGPGRSGVLFKLNPDGSDYTELCSFGSIPNDGSLPVAALLQGHDGALYGTTPGGGYSVNGYYVNQIGGTGVIFKLSTNGTPYSFIYMFNTNGLEGQVPMGALIQGNDGLLYGTTEYGGTNNTSNLGDGTVFKLNTNGSGYSVLYNFGNNSGDGQEPMSAVVQGSDGALYGTTKYGGTNSLGTVFKLHTNGTGYAVLYNFGSIAGDGQSPAGSLVQGTNGALYGITPFGGAYGYGTVFMLNTNGAGYTILYSFGGIPGDGQQPAGSLIQGADGAFYGTTVYGGDMNNGTVFRLGTAPFLFTSFSRLANNAFLLSLSGSSNTTCRIDASTNLVNWTTLTNIPDTTGGIQFTDLSATNFPRRFYRALQSP